ncbi:MAG TPA: hypothetical protein VGY55_15735 [Pirellulales bacterium]|nr:hypothetical protein [Pirellulales bacterium]
MNHEHRLVLIDNKNDLDRAPAASATSNQPLVFIFSQRIWALCVSNHGLGFNRINAVLGDVFDVPFVPAKFH